LTALDTELRDYHKLVIYTGMGKVDEPVKTSSGVWKSSFKTVGKFRGIDVNEVGDYYPEGSMEKDLDKVSFIFSYCF
jgi:hypothetical protein